MQTPASRGDAEAQGRPITRIWARYRAKSKKTRALVFSPAKPCIFMGSLRLCASAREFCNYDKSSGQRSGLGAMASTVIEKNHPCIDP